MTEKNSFIKTAIKHVKQFIQKSYDDNIAALAGQSSFFIILSVIPLMMFVFVVGSMLTGAKFQADQLSEASQQLPGILKTVADYIIRAVKQASSGTAIITAIIALWSAGKGLYCITEGISRIYRLPNKRIWLQKRIFAMGYTVIMLLMFIIILAVVAVNIFLSRSIEKAIGRSVVMQVLYHPLMQIVVSLLLAFFMTLALKLYLNDKVSDKRYSSFRVLLPGSIFTVVAWILLNYGVELYIKHFATSSIYGSFGTIAIVMMWGYFSMYILLYGIQLNYIYRETFYRRFLSKKDRKTASLPE